MRRSLSQLWHEVANHPNETRFGWFLDVVRAEAANLTLPMVVTDAVVHAYDRYLVRCGEAETEPYTFAPIVGPFLTLVLIRLILKLPLRIPAFVASVGVRNALLDRRRHLGLTKTPSTWILGALIV
jgi:hypothetical protein